MNADIAFEQELDIAFHILDKRFWKTHSRGAERIDKTFVSYPSIIRIILDNLLENAIQFITKAP